MDEAAKRVEFLELLRLEWQLGCANAAIPGGMRQILTEYHSILSPEVTSILRFYSTLDLNGRKEALTRAAELVVLPLSAPPSVPGPVSVEPPHTETLATVPTHKHDWSASAAAGRLVGALGLAVMMLLVMRFFLHTHPNDFAITDTKTGKTFDIEYLLSYLICLVIFWASIATAVFSVFWFLIALTAKTVKGIRYR